MDVSSLPKYPGPQQAAARSQRAGPKDSARMARILFDVALLAVIAVMLYALRQMTSAFDRPPTPPAPLDFKLVQERYDKVLRLEYRKVVKLLGPPTEWSREPEFQRYEDIAAAHPDRYPSASYSWEKWTDPQDGGRWVAVFFSGDIAYHVIKKGF